MLSETISKVVNGLHQNVNEYNLGNPYFQESHYRIYDFSKENLHPIDGNGMSRKIAFIDGGNQELIGAPNFSIQLNRIYFNIFSGKERIIQKVLPNKIEFFSATFSTLRNKEIDYDTLVFPVKDEWNKYLPLQSDLSFS